MVVTWLLQGHRGTSLTQYISFLYTKKEIIILFKFKMGVDCKGLEKPWQVKTAVVFETEFQQFLAVGDTTIPDGLDHRGCDVLVVFEDFPDTGIGEFRHVQCGVVDFDLFDTAMFLQQTE
jgi:hypothetical protein